MEVYFLIEDNKKTSRKKLIKKIMFLEIDEDLKNLAPEEFFLNILKREKFTKTVNYAGFFLFLLFSRVF